MNFRKYDTVLLLLWPGKELQPNFNISLLMYPQCMLAAMQLGVYIYMHVTNPQYISLSSTTTERQN